MHCPSRGAARRSSSEDSDWEDSGEIRAEHPSSVLYHINRPSIIVGYQKERTDERVPLLIAEPTHTVTQCTGLAIIGTQLNLASELFVDMFRPH